MAFRKNYLFYSARANSFAGRLMVQPIEYQFEKIILKGQIIKVVNMYI